MLTESFGLEAKPSSLDCHCSAGFHQKRGKNPNIRGGKKKVCVCPRNYILFPAWSKFTINKRQTSWLVSCARAVLAHRPRWSRWKEIWGHCMPLGTIMWLDVFSVWGRLGRWWRSRQRAPAPHHHCPSAGFRGISTLPVPAPERGLGALRYSPGERKGLGRQTPA